MAEIPSKAAYAFLWTGCAAWGLVANEVTPLACGPDLQNALPGWDTQALGRLGAAAALTLSLLPPLAVYLLQRRRKQPLRSPVPGALAWVLFLTFGAIGFWPDRFDVFNVALNRTLNHGVGAIFEAQTTFREGDRDQDEVFDYGTLEELAAAGLVDEQLASGTRGNYTFELVVGPEAPEFLWICVANPRHGNLDGSGSEAAAVIVGSLVEEEERYLYTIAPWHPDQSCQPPAEASTSLAEVMRGRPFWRNDWWARNGWKVPLFVLVAMVCAGGWLVGIRATHPPTPAITGA